jgi:hypothetical protein
MRIRNSVFCICIAILLTACSSVKVYNIHDAQNFEIKNDGLIYSLPRTVIRIEVEATKVETRKGPYADYAEKFLGITNVPLKDSVQWILSNLKITSYAEPDSSHFYCIESNKLNLSQQINLSREGLLVSLNGKDDYESGADQTDLFINQVFNEPIELTQLPVMDAQTVRIDTTYRTVFTDSSSVRIPVLRKQQVNKSLEDKAHEIADLILELREEKVAILIGDVEEFPDGKALDIIIREFQKIEEKYLPLFTGSQRKETSKAVFEFIPNDENLTRKNILFRFSEDRGILSNIDLSGRPVLIEIQQQGNTDHLKSFANHLDTIVDSESGIVYRIPDIATVKVIDETKVIATSKMPVAQYGKLTSIPAYILEEKRGRIEFYPESGALKKIDRR